MPEPAPDSTGDGTEAGSLEPDADDEELRTLIVPGFVTLSDAEEIAVELAEDAGGDGDGAAARRRARAIWAARAAELAAATGPSDADRLADAFAVLERDHGFVTAMCAGFDKTDLRDELRERRAAAGGTAWAGAGFHQQDAESLASTPAVLYLLYSVFSPNPATPQDVVDAALATDAGREALAESDAGDAATIMVRVLRNAGLDVSWDGSPASRLQVAITDWRRPLPAG